MHTCSEFTFERAASKISGRLTIRVAGKPAIVKARNRTVNHIAMARILQIIIKNIP
jgi:hypothetical protein